MIKIVQNKIVSYLHNTVVHIFLKSNKWQTNYYESCLVIQYARAIFFKKDKNLKRNPILKIFIIIQKLFKIINIIIRQ